MRKSFKELADLAVIMVLVIIVAVFINSQTTHAKTIFRDTYHGYELKISYNNGKTVIRWNGKKMRTYRGRYRVEMIDGAKLWNDDECYNKLIHRKNTRTIIIEKCHGTCEHNDYYKSGTIDGGSYIAYRCLGNKVKVDDEVYTWYVYTPRTNYDDDITLRFDVPAKYWRRNK